jgi:hypothetical protein
LQESADRLRSEKDKAVEILRKGDERAASAKYGHLAQNLEAAKAAQAAADEAIAKKVEALESAKRSMQDRLDLIKAKEKGYKLQTDEELAAHKDVTDKEIERINKEIKSLGDKEKETKAFIMDQPGRSGLSLAQELEAAERLGSGTGMGIGRAGVAGWLGTKMGLPYPVGMGAYTVGRAATHGAATVETFAKLMRISNTSGGIISAAAKKAAKALVSLEYGTKMAANTAYRNAVDSHFRESLIGGTKAKSLSAASVQRAQELGGLTPELQAIRIGHNTRMLPPGMRQSAAVLGARLTSLLQQVQAPVSSALGNKTGHVSEAEAFAQAEKSYAITHPYSALEKLAEARLRKEHMDLHTQAMPELALAQQHALNKELAKLDTSKMGPRAMAQYRTFMGEETWPPGFVTANQIGYGMPPPEPDVNQVQSTKGQPGTSAVAGNAPERTRKFSSDLATGNRMPMDRQWKKV